MIEPLRLTFEVACTVEHEWGEVTVWGTADPAGYLVGFTSRQSRRD